MPVTPGHSGEGTGTVGAALVHTPHAARYNLRDFGGYRTADGLRLKTGMLFRSGQFDDAAPEDRGLIARMRVDHVVDFRSHVEVATALPPAFAGFAGTVFLSWDPDNSVPHSMGGLAAASSAARIDELMCQVYRKLVGSGRFVETLRAYFRALAASQGATLVHCFAGKDRTGMAVALFHHAMGVDRADILGDYLMTNAMGDARIVAGLKVLQRQAPPGTPDWVLRKVMGVDEAYFEAAFAEIGSRWGSVQAYIQEATGLAPVDLAELRSKYCV